MTSIEILLTLANLHFVWFLIVFTWDVWMKFGSWLSLLLDFQTVALDSYQNSKNLSHKWDWAFNLHLTFTTAILMDGFTRVYAFNKLVNSVGINKHTSLLYLPPQYQIFWDAVQKVNEKIQKWFANVINWKIYNFRIFFFLIWC